jgi:hypothetical protein
MFMVQRVSLAAFFIASVTLLPLNLAAASIPAGQILHCRLAATLSTGVDSAGDPFTATVSEPLLQDGRQLIPAGAILQGRIASLVRPGHLKGVGQMVLQAESLRLPNGETLRVSATLVSEHGAAGVRVVNDQGRLKGPSSRLHTLALIGGGTAAGGLLGALFHVTPWGMAVGGAAGLIDQARHRGRNLNLPAGTALDFQLSQPLTLLR